MRHACRATHHHHALDLCGRQPGVTQRFAHRGQRLLHQMSGHLGEVVARDNEVHILPRAQAHMDLRFFARRQQLLGLARLHLQPTRILERRRVDRGAFQDRAKQSMIEVVPAQRGVAVGQQHLEHPARQLENGQIESATAEVIDGIHAFGCVVEAIGHRRRGGFIEQAQHVHAGKARCVLGGLALSVIEVGGHGDDCAAEFSPKAGLRTRTQHAQHFRRDLDRALDTLHRAQSHHARAILEVVGHRLHMGDILDAPTHEALHRKNGVARISGLRLDRHLTDVDTAISAIAHHRRQHRAPGFVRQAHGDAVTHRGNKGVRRSKVDTDRQPMLMRRGGHAGFGNLQQGHQGIRVSCFQPSSASRASSISCCSFSMNISRRTVSAASA